METVKNLGSATRMQSMMSDTSFATSWSTEQR